jgi:hypothetical protein
MLRNFELTCEAGQQAKKKFSAKNHLFLKKRDIMAGGALVARGAARRRGLLHFAGYFPDKIPAVWCIFHIKKRVYYGRAWRPLPYATECTNERAGWQDVRAWHECRFRFSRIE